MNESPTESQPGSPSESCSRVVALFPALVVGLLLLAPAFSAANPTQDPQSTPRPAAAPPRAPGSQGVPGATPPQGGGTGPIDERAERRITPEVLVVREASPAVVYIASNGYELFQDIFGRTVARPNRSAGTGVMVDRDGFLVTNFHVIANVAGVESLAGADARIEVQFDSEVDPKTYVAQLVSVARTEDLALLKITGERPFPTVKLGISSDLMIGERVIAIGNPFQQKLSVSSGIISGLHRDLAVQGSQLNFNDLIQTDASINHGNSGGPLLNINGELIGINTVVREDAENMGYAIPVDRVREVLLNELFAPQWAKAWYGFELEPEPSLAVARVVAGSPAAEAGLEPGDEVTAIDGFVLAEVSAEARAADGRTPRTPRGEYNHRRLTLLPGVDVPLGVRGKRGAREISLRGWTKVDGILFERLGLTVRRVRVGAGILLSLDKVDAAGPARAIGLARGDLIDALRTPDGSAWSVSDPEGLAKLVADLPAKSTLEIDILRDEDKDFLLESGELFKGKLTLR